MSYPTILYLSILSNSVTLITLCYLCAPPTATIDDALGNLRAVLESTSPTQTSDATTQTEPTTTTTATQTEVNHDNLRSHQDGRNIPYADRLDLNQPWQEVDFTIDGRNWGIFSLPELATILHDHYICPLRRRLQGQTDRNNRENGVEDEVLLHME